MISDIGPLNDGVGVNYPVTGLAFNPVTGVLTVDRKQYASVWQTPCHQPCFWFGHRRWFFQHGNFQQLRVPPRWPI